MVATGRAALNGGGRGRTGGAQPGGGRRDRPPADSRHLGPDVEGEAHDATVHLSGVGSYRAGGEEVAARGYEGSAPTASAVTS